MPPHLSGMCSACIVNNDVVNIAQFDQFEPDWEAEDISEDDWAEPVQARLLIVFFVFLLSNTFRYAVICKWYCFFFNIWFYPD